MNERSLQVPMSGPDITDAEIDAVNQVLRSPFLSNGPWLTRFEQRVSEYVGARQAVAVSSGTAGLHICVVAAGLREGDLCITTPFSFVASANCLLYEGLTPVFVDVDPVTLNIDVAQVTEAVEGLTSGSSDAKRYLPPSLRDQPMENWLGRLRVILPVHAFGQPVDMDPILRAARAHQLVVIEDACESIGSTYKGQQTGTMGDMGVFAFYPNKQITTGEGGMIVTNREELAAVSRSLRNQGRDIFDTWLDHSRLGFNYRIDEMSAALGATQLTRIEELLDKRARVARMYTQRIETISGVSVPTVVDTTTRMSWFLYVVRLSPGIDRKDVMAYLEERGVPSRAYFSPIHLQPFYRQRYGYGEGDFPISESAGRAGLALPFSSVMGEREVDIVCDGLREAIRATSRA